MVSTGDIEKVSQAGDTSNPIACHSDLRLSVDGWVGSITVRPECREKDKVQDDVPRYNKTNIFSCIPSVHHDRMITHQFDTN